MCGGKCLSLPESFCSVGRALRVPKPEEMEMIKVPLSVNSPSRGRKGQEVPGEAFSSCLFCLRIGFEDDAQGLHGNRIAVVSKSSLLCYLPCSRLAWSSLLPSMQASSLSLSGPDASFVCKRGTSQNMSWRAGTT